MKSSLRFQNLKFTLEIVNDDSLPRGLPMALKQDYYKTKALSNTGLKKILRSPEHFQHWLKAERKMSKSLILGELMHYFLLTPELVPEEIAIFERGKSLNGKLANRFIMANPDKFICTREQYEFASAAANKVLKNRFICRLIGREGAKREHAIYTEIDGVPCKALLDMMTDEIILDVKTTTDEGGYFNNAESFDNKFFSYGYDIQAAWYQKIAYLHDGILRDVIFVVVEMEEPHGVTVRGIHQEDIDEAWEQCDKAIQIYRECNSTGIWPGYPMPKGPDDLQYVKKKWKKKAAV